MAKVVQTVERDGHKIANKGIKVLKNGSVYDLDKGRIVSSINATTKITKENTAEYHSRRHERKRAILAAAANSAVERGDYRTEYGDMAFVAAIGETAYIKATTPDDPKAIDAARFLLQETGLAQAQQQQAENQADSGLRAVIADLARIADAAVKLRVHE